MPTSTGTGSPSPSETSGGQSRWKQQLLNAVGMELVVEGDVAGEEEDRVEAVLGVLGRALPLLGRELAQVLDEEGAVAGEPFQGVPQVEGEERPLLVLLGRLVGGEGGVVLGEQSAPGARGRSACTSARWQACSCADHLPGAGRRLTISGAPPRTSGTRSAGALASAVRTAAGSFTKLASKKTSGSALWRRVRAESSESMPGRGWRGSRGL